MWDLLDLITFWLFADASEDSQRQMEILLTQPPPNAVIEEDDPIWGSDSESELFANLLSQSND
jgi:hypothetical protein